jgi:DNA invertase Pin-like site-specific DNA recombinase
MRRGDTLIVCRLDRLARSVGDLHRIIEQLNAAGVLFRCLQQGGVDTATSTGKLMLAILGAVAEFENDLRSERQRDGIERAKERGVYCGRPPSIDAAAIQALRDDGLGPSAIARKLGIARASVYRLERSSAGRARTGRAGSD